MLTRLLRKNDRRQEGESPFWISFSDLMSALMVLFLVVMAVTLVSITESIKNSNRAQTERNDAISKVMAIIAKDAKKKGVGVDQQNHRIDLGRKAHFDSNSYVISNDDAQFLRDYVPILLRAKETPEGQRWMRSVVVEGFTDEDGTYLYNLELSLQRSRSVVCALFNDKVETNPLGVEDLRKIQELFLVGGYSFNSVKKDKAESRRVEFKIDFWGLGESRPLPRTQVLQAKDFGKC